MYMAAEQAGGCAQTVCGITEYRLDDMKRQMRFVKVRREKTLVSYRETKNSLENYIYIYICCGPVNKFGYGLDGPGIESRWGEIFRPRPDRPWGPPSLLYNGYRLFPVGKATGA
jgi:hypothetical protein